MGKNSFNIALIELEEIEISIKIKIQRKKVVILDIPYKDNLIYNKILKKIENLSPLEEFRPKALPESYIEKKEIISLIQKYINKALLHLKNANKIIKDFL